MKNTPSIIAAVLLMAILLMYWCTFQVRSTEVAIKKTFGNASEKPIRIDEDDISFFAGLNLKWPWPIQSVVKYDTRLRLLEGRIEEAPTLDSKQIIVTTFATWRIVDPYKFHTRYNEVKSGEEALRTRIRSLKKAVIGKHNFSDFVSTKASDRKLQEIEQEMMDAIETDAQKDFGVEICMFGIKQLALPANVTQAVFTTMKKTQEVKADKYRSEGDAEGTRIRAAAQAASGRIMAMVERKVARIESEGLSEVGEIYKKFKEHEELRIFLDQLRSIELILNSRSEVFLDTEIQPFNLWNEKTRIEKPTAPGGN
ncbi:MAG: protein HflC [Phycisphaerae bacterium]|nr:MAG: protein HflC [Phycisphaerae bacterium]